MQERQRRLATAARAWRLVEETKEMQAQRKDNWCIVDRIPRWRLLEFTEAQIVIGKL